MTDQNVPHSSLAAGSIIADKYRVERVLGKGGMGVVVAARHIKLGETVAIKLMLNDILCSPEAIERFLREAQACAKLRNNEHITRVSDIDVLPNGRPYMVMELLDGQDLDKILKERGVFPIHEACSHIIHACKALGDAHQKGIIHRDLKPQNLFLTKRPDGSPCVKVLDFGISKYILADNSAAIDLTRPSDILGSAYYMSPEQARASRSVVPQSDIYSLGAVLYKLLTGRAPFPYKTLLDVYKALFDETPVAPSKIRFDIPNELERIILRCLEKDVNRRFSNAYELMGALAPFTVPGEITRVDETDSESVTTAPIRRAPQSTSLNGTQLLVPLPHAMDMRGNGASGQSTSSTAGRPEIGFQTQPLDARSLHAALHEYLPPKTTKRPPAPSNPHLPNAPDLTPDAPTPRIALHKSARPEALRDEPVPRTPQRSVTNEPRALATKTPLPAPVNLPAIHGTIYVTSVTQLINQSISSEGPSTDKKADKSKLPQHPFPAAGEEHRRPKTTLIALAGGAIAVLVVLLVLMKFLS